MNLPLLRWLLYTKHLRVVLWHSYCCWCVLEDVGVRGSFLLGSGSFKTILVPSEAASSHSYRDVRSS